MSKQQRYVRPISTSITVADYRTLHAHAAAQGLSVSALVRAILRAAAQRHALALTDDYAERAR